MMISFRYPPGPRQKGCGSMPDTVSAHAGREIVVSGPMAITTAFQ
jgi:hypothetical protein